MTLHTFKDAFELATGSEAITQEAHVIPATSPYAIDLYGVPQVVADVTTLADNLYVDAATVASWITLEVEIASVWTAFTPTDTSSPAVLKYYCQCQEEANPFSPRLIVNAAYANLNARVTYTSLGAQPLAQWWLWLQRWLMLVDAGRMPVGVSQSNWHGGALDGRGADDASLWLMASDVRFQTSSGKQTFPGLLWDATDGGAQQVTAFVNSAYWKRITLGVVWDTDEFVVATAESVESESQSLLADPAALSGDAYPICYLDVQQDGTADMQAINAVTQADITPYAATIRPTASAWQPIRMSHSGELLGGDFDVPLYPGRGGIIRQIDAYINDTGEGEADATNIDIWIDNVTALTTVIAINANNHEAGHAVASLDGDPTFTATSVIRASMTAIPTEGADASLVFWLEFTE